MKAYLAAVSAVALCAGFAACAEFPTPQYPVSQPVAVAPQPAPQPVPVPAPAPAAAAPDDTPKARPSAPIGQSTLPPPARRPGAFLDRGLDVTRPGLMLARWRADDDAQTYPAATRHKAAKRAPKAQADDETVTVGKGDTLASLARAHATTIDALAKLNGLKSPYRLTAGQSLKLPGGGGSDEASSSDAPKAKSSKSAASEKPSPSESVKVGKGDTLASISRKSGVSIAELARINGLDAPYRLKAGQTIQLKAAEQEAAASDTPRSKAKAAKAAPADDDQDEAPGVSTITVRRKDSIQSLARQSHVSVAELARLNHLKKPYRLKPGQQIRLPDRPGAVSKAPATVDDLVAAAPTTVTAGRNDTLKSIAERHGVSVSTLAKLNHLKKPYRIKRGQKIRLPGRAVEERAPEPSSSAPSNATSYRVQTGDTLYSIARRFGTDARTLADLNGMEANARLTAGRRIRLPGRVEDRIAPRPGRIAPPSSAPPAPVPYTSLPSNPPLPAAPGAVTPPTPPPAAQNAPRQNTPSQNTPGQNAPSQYPPSSTSSPLAPYRPSAPPAEAPAAGDAEIAAAGKGLFLWPVRGEILQRFGPIAGGGQRSDGLDIAGAAGTPVVAAAGGEVVYAGNSLPGFGNMVLLRHEGGWVTVYAHLANLDVKMRQTVNQGQTIGAVGKTGGVADPQLHFEVRYAPNTQDKPRTIDPLLVLPQ